MGEVIRFPTERRGVPPVTPAPPLDDDDDVPVLGPAERRALGLGERKEGEDRA